MSWRCGRPARWGAASAALELPGELRELCDRKLSGPAEVHVAHQWPPDFQPPAEGHWVIMQPWEFGSLPTAWIGPMKELVDEVWVPSRFVRDCFIKSGVPGKRVRVIPLGVNLNRGVSGVETAYFLPAREVHFREKRIDRDEAVDCPWLPTRASLSKRRRNGPPPSRNSRG